MLRQPTFDKLHSLRLRGMAEAFEQQLNQPDPLCEQVDRTNAATTQAFRFLGHFKMHVAAAEHWLLLVAPRPRL